MVKIGVIRGGQDSDRYHLNIKSGAMLLQSLPEEYQVYDVLIDKEGKWHFSGIQKKPIEIFHLADVFVDFSRHKNASYIPQTISQISGARYIGPPASYVLLARNKQATKPLAFESAVELGSSVTGAVNIPKHVHVPAHISDAAEFSREIFSKFPPPYVIKPLTGSYSAGLVYVPHLKKLTPELESVLRFGEDVMVEEYIFGKDYSIVLLEDIRGQDVYPLPVAHIKHDQKLLNQQAKQSAQVITPAEIPFEQKQIITEFAKKMWEKLHARYFLKLDFRITPFGKIYFLEANAIPSFAQNSVLELSLQELGLTVSKVFEHYIHKSLYNKPLL